MASTGKTLVVATGDTRIRAGLFDMTAKGLVIATSGGKFVVCTGDIIVYGGNTATGRFMATTGGQGHGRHENTYWRWPEPLVYTK